MLLNGIALNITYDPLRSVVCDTVFVTNPRQERPLIPAVTYPDDFGIPINSRLSRLSGSCPMPAPGPCMNFTPLWLPAPITTARRSGAGTRRKAFQEGRGARSSARHLRTTQTALKFLNSESQKPARDWTFAWTTCFLYELLRKNAPIGRLSDSGRRPWRPSREVRRNRNEERPPSRGAATPKAAERLSPRDQRTVSTRSVSLPNRSV
jgi:hypothetical protein